MLDGSFLKSDSRDFFFQGLVVPVIRNVEGMNFADIENAISLLGEKVRL